MQMLPNKKNATKKLFLDFNLLWPFLTKKQPKLTKNEENCQNRNRLMKFSEIWYVDASQQKKCHKKLFLDFGLFCPFLTKKRQKLTINEENWKNPNRSMKFLKFDMQLLTKKQPKLSKNEEN